MKKSNGIVARKNIPSSQNRSMNERVAAWRAIIPAIDARARSSAVTASMPRATSAFLMLSICPGPAPPYMLTCVVSTAV